MSLNAEDFEWGNDGDPVTDSGGSETWTVEGVVGLNKADIDTAQYHAGTRSLLLYRDEANVPIVRMARAVGTGYNISFWIRMNPVQRFYFSHGNGTQALIITVASDGDLATVEDEGGSTLEYGLIQVDTWHHFEIRNISWTRKTYDVYVDDDYKGTGDDFWSSASGDNSLQFQNSGTGGNVSMWIDDIEVTISSHIIDSAAAFETWGVESGWIVKNRTDGTQTTVDTVDGETRLTCMDDIFESGDFYTVEYKNSDMQNILDIKWNENPFSAGGNLIASNTKDFYDSTDFRHKQLRIWRGYERGGIDYYFEHSQFMKISGQKWGSQPEYPSDSYTLNFKGLWGILANYKTPVDLFFNQEGENDGLESHSDDTTIEDMTAHEMLAYVIMLAGLTLGDDIQDTSAEYISTKKPKITFYAGTTGAYMAIAIIAMFQVNLLARNDSMHLVITDNDKSYEYRTPTDDNYLSALQGSYVEKIPTILKCTVMSADGTYSGTYTDPSWSNDMGELTWLDTYDFIDSDELCEHIAEARVQRAISNVETGSLFLPIMDVCQEIWTTTIALDERGNISGTGLTGGLYFHYGNRGKIYSLSLRLGGLSPTSDIDDYMNQLGMGLGGIPADSVLGLDTVVVEGGLKWAIIMGG